MNLADGKLVIHHNPWLRNMGLGLLATRMGNILMRVAWSLS